MTRRGLLWAFAAMLGIAITAALTWSVSLLAGQRIGLSSQPVSVIHGLAPPEPTKHQKTAITAHLRSAPRAGPAHSAPVLPAPPAAHAATPANSAPIQAAPSGPAPATSSVQAATPAGRQSASSAGSRSSPGGDHRDESGGGGSGSSSQRDD